jgi:hypothetical protein
VLGNIARAGRSTLVGRALSVGQKDHIGRDQAAVRQYLDFNLHKVVLAQVRQAIADPGKVHHVAHRRATLVRDHRQHSIDSQSAPARLPAVHQADEREGRRDRWRRRPEEGDEAEQGQ